MLPNNLMSGELHHYGVPGMKWGVRRTRNTNNRAPSPKKKQNSSKKTLKKDSAKGSLLDYIYENPTINLLAAIGGTKMVSESFEAMASSGKISTFQVLKAIGGANIAGNSFYKLMKYR